ncbi:ABC transporter permease [Brooklawnia cerclae]|nr:ABC transporter permease [Brooklawnia cerclae]
MQALAILVARNVRHRRGQALAMLLLAAVAAVPLNLGIIMATGYPRLIEDSLTSVNASDFMALVPDDDAAGRFVEQLRADSDITELEADTVLAGPVDTTFGGERASVLALVFDSDARPRLDGWHTISQTSDPLDHPILAPAIYGAGGGYSLGQQIDFSSPAGDLSFQVQGFAELPTMGVPNMGAVGFGVPGEQFDDLLREPGPLSTMLLVKARTIDSGDATQVLADNLAEYNNAHPGATVTPAWDVSRDLLAEGVLLGANIFAAALVAFAVIIVVVALVVIRFLTVNAIDGELRQLGVLRATGFTTGQVITTLVATSAASAAAGSVVGVGLSYAVLPTLADSLSDQTGLLWQPGFSVVGFLATVVLLTGAVLVMSAVAALRVRRMGTLTALRGGEVARGSGHHPLPLAITPGPLNWLLGAKQALVRLPQTLLVGATMLVVTAMSVIAVSLSVNILGDPAAFTRMMVGDMPDAQVVTPDAEAADRVRDEAAALPGVEQAFMSELTGLSVNNINTSVYVADDFGRLRYDATYEGRMPSRDDEVVLGSVLADQLGVSTGDEVALTVSEHTATYLVTGETSSGRGMGRSLDLTVDAMRRLDPGYQADTVSLQVSDPAQIPDLLDRLSAASPDDVVSTENVVTSLSTQLSGYQSMIAAMSVIILAFMGVVVVLVVALVVSTLIVHCRRRYGTLKALGFTSADLAAQTAMTQLPAVLIGSLLGGAAGMALQNPVMIALLSGLGIKKAGFWLPWTYPLGLAVVVTVLAALVCWLDSLSLRRISAYALVTE